MKNKNRVSKRKTSTRCKTTKMRLRERHKLAYRKWRAHQNENRQKRRRSSSKTWQSFLKNHWLKQAHTDDSIRNSKIDHRHHCWKWNKPLFKKLNLKSFYTTFRILNSKKKISKKFTNWNLMISSKQVKNWLKTRTKRKWRRKLWANRKTNKWKKKIRLRWKW